MNNQTEITTSTYLEEVCSYYDKINPIYLQYAGTTYQSGLVGQKDNTVSTCANNLYLAARAGIKPGDRILDAGCGVGGPSIDIAQNLAGVKIDAITISNAQAKAAKELVQLAGLAEQINIHVGDYHELIFADQSFDVVFFFESSGHSYNRHKLFKEIWRVLRPGGNLYIKDVFSQEHLSAKEQKGLAEFDKIYVHKTPKMSETVDAILSVGFEAVKSQDLSEIISMQYFLKAMFEFKFGFPFLTELGKYHYRKIQCQPIFFGEIKARKPA